MIDSAAMDDGHYVPLPWTTGTRRALCAAAMDDGH